jgi:ubiquilin
MGGVMGDFGPMFAAPSTAPARPPEEQYATQLVQIQEMGFSDRQAILQALTATRGNVQAAIDRLLGMM